MWQASARAVLKLAFEMCVTMDSAIGIGAAKVQRFIGKGISQIIYVDGKIRQSTLYAGRGQLCSIVCNPKVLAGTVGHSFERRSVSTRWQTPLKFVLH